MFQHISEHLEVRHKYSTERRRIFNSFLGFWKWGKTRSFLFYVLLTKSWCNNLVRQSLLFAPPSRPKIFLWVYQRNKPRGMLGEYQKSLGVQFNLQCSPNIPSGFVPKKEWSIAYYYLTFIHCANSDFLIGWFVPRDTGLWRNNLLDVDIIVV